MIVGDMTQCNQKCSKIWRHFLTRDFQWPLTEYLYIFHHSGTSARVESSIKVYCLGGIYSSLPLIVCCAHISFPNHLLPSHLGCSTTSFLMVSCYKVTISLSKPKSAKKVLCCPVILAPILLDIETSPLCASVSSGSWVSTCHIETSPFCIWCDVLVIP